jgi:hypothetical protein
VGIRFFDVEYRIPADLIANKTKVNVRFEAANGRSTPSIFEHTDSPLGHGTLKSPGYIRRAPLRVHPRAVVGLHANLEDDQNGMRLRTFQAVA